MDEGTTSWSVLFSFFFLSLFFVFLFCICKGHVKWLRAGETESAEDR